jgi:hypothetical protein
MVKYEKEGNQEGWIGTNMDTKVTRPKRLEEFLGKGSVPTTDYKVRYSLDDLGELNVYSPGSVIKDGHPNGGVLCFLYDIPEWEGKRIHREVILGGKKK